MSEFNASRSMVVITARELLRKLGRHFEITISAYLESKYGTDIEMVGDDPRRFYSALEELFGEFAAKIFMYDLTRELNIPVKSTDIEDLLKGLEMYLGE
ncbi:DUF3227 domain-containing protein [Thermococcus sp. M36]|uniref:NitrOD5 domain-containing protein n=1 Tax=Thermococcus sp. M36 TaxID=1638261 RepID=UPI001439CFC8|nr:NitrOD5 domain-containing protein [Thermococcus sp. M36]NJE05815.1 DUF3227 domain-containing protein [Thermococcus sp. M36]